MTLPSRIPGPPAALANPSLLPPDDAAARQAFLEQRRSDQDGLISVRGRHLRSGPRTLPQVADPALPRNIKNCDITILWWRS